MAPNTRLFAWHLADTRLLVNFLKTAETITAQSDTALFKVNARGIYIKLTDYESFAALELRLAQEQLRPHLQTWVPEYSVKIRLDSLTELLQAARRRKKRIYICALLNKPERLCVQEMSVQGQKVLRNSLVTSTEHRPRVYHLLSTTQFRRLRPEYAEYTLPNIEFNKLITRLSILNGVQGGVVELTVSPTPTAAKPNRVEIKFAIESESPIKGYVKIHTCTQAKTRTNVLHAPKRPVKTRFLLTYLKRCQNLFNVPSNWVHVWCNDHGLMLQTCSRSHNRWHSPVVLFVCDLNRPQPVNLDSYA